MRAAEPDLIVARSSLHEALMRRAVKALPLAILVIAGVVLLLRDTDGREKVSATVTSPTVAPRASVEVEHTLVTAEVVRPPIVAPPPVKSAASTLRSARATANGPTRRQPAVKGRSTLGEKTRVLLLGDGRHKPQPFPRINN